MNCTKIRIGKTRIVIVTGSYAYKIVRIRIFDLICKLLYLEYDRRRFGDKIAFKRLRRHSRTQLLTDMLWACFRANYTEYHRWKRCPDYTRYVPTLFTFFYIINIQERDDVEKDYSNKLIASAHNRKCGELAFLSEISHSDNIATSGRILDYGGHIF
ncbi:MAG: hypothetical protein WC682_04195 [Parcubacteria group bacterium]|jgi:hypothetical protein